MKPIESEGHVYIAVGRSGDQIITGIGSAGRHLTAKEHTEMSFLRDIAAIKVDSLRRIFRMHLNKC